MKLVTAVIWVAGLAVVVAGTTNDPRTASDHALFRARAELSFTNAVLLKPIETRDATNAAFRLAPLIVQEVFDTNYHSKLPEGKNLRSSNSRMPVVYFQENTIVVNGQSHVRIAYVWGYGAAKAKHGASLAAQGIRLTLNHDGLPVIWEVLSDSTGARVIYVSEAIEAAAGKVFGHPPAGRRFAIESDLGKAPATVVARVISDGPMAMGPIVCLTAGAHEVSALICRCMPAQARNLVGTETYALSPLSKASNGALFKLVEKNTPLAEHLRLPPDF